MLPQAGARPAPESLCDAAVEQALHRLFAVVVAVISFLCIGLEADTRLEAIASRLEAVAIRFKAAAVSDFKS